ncbi:MAG: hypothetical protein H8E35_15345 [Ardenticatenia bacterium]|nr:hypothetical protein [Ardenticatenia bacterium]
MSGSDDDGGEFALLPTNLNWFWLLDWLRRVQGHKPMMASALAGSGQSTLLCQRLDAGDNGPAAFVSRLIATIQTVFPTPQAMRSASSRKHPVRRWRQDHASRELEHPPGLLVDIRHHSDPLCRCAAPGAFRVQKMTNLLLHHDDSEPEYTYTHNAERTLQVAQERGWTVVSMKTGFKTVFSFQ